MFTSDLGTGNNSILLETEDRVDGIILIGSSEDCIRSMMLYSKRFRSLHGSN